MKDKGIRFRLVLVIALAVILVAVSISAPTFSWFARPKESSGGGITVDVDKNYYTGKGVTISKTEYYNPSSASADPQGYVTVQNPRAYNSLPVGSRDYYTTTLHNSTSVDQYVSLYIGSLSTSNSSGQCVIGVNTPVKGYRNYSVKNGTFPDNSSNTATVSDNNLRVYFQPKNADKWNGASGGYVIGYTTGSTSITWSNNQPSNVQWTAPMGVTATAGTLYTDVPKNVNQMIIKINNAEGDSAWGKTPVITRTALAGENSGHPTSFDQTHEVVFTLTERASTNGMGNAGYEVYSIDGAKFFKRYSTVNIKKGDVMDLRLVKGTDYIASSVSYSSSNTGVFTVNNGKIKAVGTGTATLTTKAKNSFGDEVSVTTSVTVTTIVPQSSISLEDVPIVQNVKVPANSENVAEKDVIVKWFIKNDKDASGSLSYNLSNVYVGL